MLENADLIHISCIHVFLQLQPHVLRVSSVAPAAAASLRTGTVTEEPTALIDLMNRTPAVSPTPPSSLVWPYPHHQLSLVGASKWWCWTVEMQPGVSQWCIFFVGDVVSQASHCGAHSSVLTPLSVR